MRHGRIARLAAVFICLTAFVAQIPSTAAPPAPPPGSLAVVAAGLGDSDLLTLSAAVACHPAGVLLLDSVATRPYLRAFLQAYRPERTFVASSSGADLSQALGVKVDASLAPPIAASRVLSVHAHRVVLSAAQPRALLMQATCLAGTLHAPLIIDPTVQDVRRLAERGAREVLVVGALPLGGADLPDVHLLHLADAAAVAVEHVRRLASTGTIRSLVVANPADESGLSVLAPWVALRHHAPLLLTNREGTNVEPVVHAARAQPELRRADSVLLVGGGQAIRTEHRPNPEPGKDTEIEMEPLTPTGDEPFSFAVGRLFHDDPAVVPLMLARRVLWERKPPPYRALVVSNPGGSLPFLEVFSRNTARELDNRGFQTTARFRDEVDKDELRRLLPEQDVFLWEGHYMTMVRDYGMPGWNEPMSPALVFLQSCLALNESGAQPLLRRGAIGVVGSSTRTFSGTGGAFTLAFFDALLYEDDTVGGALRNAKNFLLAYSLLKRQLLGENARLIGANVRSSWAFSFWGDPTLRLPHPAPPGSAMPAVHHRVRGDTLVVTLPGVTYDTVSTGPYQAQMPPNARLAGLVSKEETDEGRRLVPFLFAEVRFPDAPPGLEPHLRGRLPHKHWVFLWDRRRGCGYLLVTPRPDDQRELRFHIAWSG